MDHQIKFQRFICKWNLSETYFEFVSFFRLSTDIPEKLRGEEDELSACVILNVHLNQFDYTTIIKVPGMYFTHRK